MPNPVIPHERAADRFRRSRLAALPLAVATLAASLVGSVAGVLVDPGAAPVAALGTPDIVVTKTADGRTLIGGTTNVTLRACNPVGQPSGYNLSFRDIIPSGLALTSATPAPTRTVPNQPIAGQTTLIWENVSDLLTGACNSITYGIDTNADNNLTTNPVGSTFGTTGGAYVNTNAFFIPDFDANGTPTTDITGSDTDGPPTTSIAAFITEKEAGNAGEGELLRGVHGAHPRIYTLRVRNNPDTASNGFSIEDLLPPSLEFLGCASYLATGYTAGTDNTVDAPTNETVGLQTDEYPGSGRMALGAAAATCIEPSTIETLGDGSTRVRWSSAALGSAANLGANGVLTITYLAGIPLRSNTDTWPNGKPTDASLGQGRNLDNNDGAPTSEEASEPNVINTVVARGTYQGPSAFGTNPTLNEAASATVTSEDLVIRKSASGQVIQGSIVTSSLVVETSEYRDVTDIVVTDTLPDGLCPVATTAISIDADCGTGADPTIDVGSGAVAAPYTSAVENADGTWTLVWDHTTIAGLAALAHSSQLTIVFQSRVRSFYQENGSPVAGRPILNFDSLTNQVAVEAPDFNRGDIDPVLGDPEVDGQLDFDVSSAGITGIGPSIDKRVSQRSGSLLTGGLSASTVGDACRDDVGITWADGSPSPVTGFRPGDFVCFDLRATFPANVDADGVVVEDLLPAQFALVPGSARQVTTGATPDTLTGTSVLEDTSGANDTVTFALASSGQVPSSPSGQQFHWTIAARLIDPNLSAAYDINANLMKMTTRNTAGSVFMYRDQSTAEWTEPQVKLDKSNNASGPLDAGDTVDYTIRLWNDGNVDGANAEVWDRLPTGITCADVTVMNPVSGVCTAGVIRWPAAAVPTVARDTTLGTAPVSLTYTVDLPAGVDPGRTYTNTAGVRRYETVSNADDSPFVYYPSSNIDGTVVPNTGPATDNSTITIATAAVGKVQQSSVNDAVGNAGNASPSTTAERATIGETITYTITATIPEGTSVVDARIVDALDGDLVLHASPAVLVNGAPDAAWVVTAPSVGSGGTIQVDRAGTHVNAAGSGPDLVTVVIVARVSSAVGTVAGSAISNTSSFSWLPDASIGTSRVTVNGNTVTATVVEPSITLTKNENDADDIVVPNDTLTYTLVVAAGSGANRSSAHDVQVVDTIPAGVTVVNAGTPVADGGAVNPDGGIWNQTARTITWNATTTAAKLGSIARGTNASLTYDVVVDDPATSGSIFTNTVAASATSMIGTVTGERTTYSANATDTVSAPMATVAKSVSPGTATVGDTVTYTIDATVPAGITTYDATVIDVLPDGMDFDAFGTVSATGVTTGCPSLAGVQPIVNQTSNADGSTTIGFWIDDFTSSSANNCTVRFTYTARVDNTYVPEGTNVVSGNALVNTVRMYWNNTNSVSSVPANPPATGSFARSSSPATATVTVAEPVLRIDKDVSQSPCDQVPGNIGDGDTCNTDIGTGTYTYTLTITNSSSWPAHDITVVDDPDADLVNVTVPGSSGAITVTDGTAPNLQWQISTIAANSTATITYTAQLAASAALNDGEQIVNTADVTEYYARSAATRSADPVAEWRTYGQGGAGGDVTADTVTMTVGFPNVTVVKTAIDDATDARVGVGFTWRIVATNQTAEPTAAAYGVDIDDVLPAGWVYQVGSASITTPYGTVTTDPVCTPNCATPGASLLWSNLVSGAGQPLAPGATIRIDFDAVPQASLLTVGTTGSFDHTNTAGVPGAEDVTGASSNADGVYTGPDSTANARIRRTDLSVTKTVSSGPYAFGNDVNWTIVVANAGPDTATGVTVADVLPVGLVYVNTISASQGSYSSGTGIWTVGSVANGASATLVIRTRLNQIGSITNRAEVQTNNQWDVDSTPNSAGPIANEDDDDTLTINASFTSLGDYVWYDIDGDSTVDGGEPGIPGVRMILESEGLDATFNTADDFWGPDGVAGGGDDIIVTDAVTNGTGFYGFADLPTGDYRVRVDTTTLPLGMTPTFNDDAPNLADPDLDHRSGLITLNSSTGYLLADFGYTGTGSLGDTIWLDKDASGGSTQQGGEPGLAGLDITLVWGGFDGNVATAGDNVTYPVDTTDSNGQYLFTRLPAGAYRVTVDAADVPTGTSPTYDLDGIGTAHTAAATLTAAQNRLDVDLSYAGTGSIGDRVWYDRDGDGVQDLGETGLANIDVTITWLGVNGVSGGGDDVVFTTTTDAAGDYLVDHLPAGAFTVLVDAADLPAGMQPTYDLDGTGTPHGVATSLTAGQDRTDVDFGYIGVASIGDQVWFDLDGDGAAAPEPGDPGLAGIAVTVRWAGPDATFDNADDVVVVTTTDADGEYLVTDLPYGPVRVSLDPASLPGFEATFDGDGIGTANRVTVTLTVDDSGTAGVDEANRRDADFAYTGTGSIGDLVWEDADADGTLDGTESGLDGIDLTITWAGLDGTAGTADDVAFPVTTAGGGLYLVDRLPAGSYTAVVTTTTLPTGMVSVSELDPLRDSRTTATLAAGQDRTDVDFGYQLQADLSIDKSHTGRFEVGRNGVYTLLVRNAGPAPAVTPRITDLLPLGLTFVSAEGLGAGCTANGQSVTCDLLTMAVNATATVTLTVAVDRSAAPGVTNSATVSSPTTDPVPTNNTDIDPTEVPLADLSITKRLEGSLAVNATVTYVLEATNLGPSPSGAPIVVTDDLPVGLTFVDATSTTATCAAVGQVVTCRSATAVAVGQVVRVDIRARVTAAAGTALINSASVAADPSFGASTPGDPVATNNAAATPASVVAATLPVTGWALIRQSLEAAFWMLALGGLAIVVGRRRRRNLPIV